MCVEHCIKHYNIDIAVLKFNKWGEGHLTLRGPGGNGGAIDLERMWG